MLPLRKSEEACPKYRFAKMQTKKNRPFFKKKYLKNSAI